MTTVAWVSLVMTLVLVWGVALWSLTRTLSREARRKRTGAPEPYDPRARRELQAWLVGNGRAPEAALARERLGEGSGGSRPADGFP